MVEGSVVFRDVEIVSIRGELPNEVTQLTCDSRLVEPGGVFVALRGMTYDGHCFLPDVYRRGAGCAVVETFSDIGLSQVQVQDTLAGLPRLAANFYRRPGDQLFMIGVTGSNGKTTFTYLMEDLLCTAGRSCGVISTIEYRYGRHKTPAPNTTPLPDELQRLLRAMLDESMDTVVMEVSSHGLALHRVDETGFDVAVFTNLSQDHLDFHGSMEAYREAKRLLFTRHLKPDGKAVINVDDEAGRMYLQDIPKHRRVTYSIDQPADVSALNIRTHLSGNAFTLRIADQHVDIHTPLIGRYNVYNVLGVCAAAWSMGIAVDAIYAGLQSIRPVPGRLERVENTVGAQVVVDYCHTPDALEKCLETLHAIPHNRLITVFGCGGDRDPMKRPLMARAADRYSDIIIVTSDNPRTENPQHIIEQITAGLRGSSKRVEVIPDRREAIHAAVSMLEEKDIVLLAGKGHEDYQIIGREKGPFDDRIVARDCLRKCGKG